MRHFISYCLFIIFALLLTGSVDEAKDESPSKTNLTIESYSVSEKEKLLISKTGVQHIEYFKVNGTLKKEDDLQFSVEVYENGKFKDEGIKSLGAIETNYKDSLISFGVIDNASEEPSLKLLVGIPDGLSSTTYTNNMTGFAFTKLIGEEITLEKDKPKYLAGWFGTNTNRLRTIGGVNGELPEEVEEYELVYLYKVLWTDKEMP